MEKINLVELLKDCPTGMELDCTMFDNVTFGGISNGRTIVVIRRTVNHKLYLDKYGCPLEHFKEDLKCVIFPKGKTTWEGFVPPCKFKDGDIITDSLGTCIFKGEGEFEGTVNYYCGISNDYFCVKDDKCNPSGHYGYIVNYRLSTEEEKEKLFKAIHDNGYKWNEDTKTLEKLIESKEDVDDEILMSGIYFDRKYHADEVELHLGNYEIEIRDGRTYAVFKNQKTKTFEQPKFKIGDRIKQIGSDRHYIIKNIEFDRYILNNNQFIRFIDEHIYELAPNKLVEPKFKVGDRIRTKKDAPINISNILITKVDECGYKGVIGYTTNPAHINFKYQDLYELVPNKLVEPKFKLGDSIVERNSINIPWIVNSISSEYYGLKLPKGSEDIGVLPVSEQDKWELVPNKFDINT